MGKKKIIISTDILSEYASQEQLDDISLKFTIEDAYSTLKADLSDLNNGTLERRKELNKFKIFLINAPYSISTKKNH